MVSQLERYREIYNNKLRNLAEDIEELPTLEITTKPYLIENICSALLKRYYDIAVLGYLLDAEIEGFYANLFRAAKSHLYLIETHKTIQAINWSYIRASNILSTQCALASGNLELARQISKSQVKEFVSPYDPADFYLYCIALRQIIEDDTLQTDKTLEEFDKARRGKREGAAVVLRSLVKKDEAEFDKGIRLFIDEWKTIVQENDFRDLAGGVRPGEETICVQALGLIFLAESIGIKCYKEYPMVPREIREFEGFVPPTDGYPKTKNS